MEFGEMKGTSPAIFKIRCFPIGIEGGADVDAQA